MILKTKAKLLSISTTKKTINFFNDKPKSLMILKTFTVVLNVSIC
jgi:hypothetical protein